MNERKTDTLNTRNLPLTQNFILKWFALSLILHLLLAWFSLGFYNLDEHFQILEFAGFKAGLIHASSLTWEYRAQIRSTFQPYVAYSIIKLLQAFHCYDPFLAATVLRFISAIVGWASSLLISLAGLYYIENERLQKFFIIVSSVLSPLIFIHVRFSSEGWAGSLAFMGIALVLLLVQNRGDATQSQKKRMALLFLSGFLMGLAYICRYQVVIIVFVFMLWLLVIAKTPMRDLSRIAIGIFSALLVGALLDRLFYGEWVNTAYRYFDVNIIKGVASQFGTEPWWWYIEAGAKSSFFYLQIPIIALVVLAFFTRPKNPFVWVSVAFIAAHFAISHKEFRFLFPLADALPLLLVLGLMVVIRFFKYNEFTYKMSKWVLVPLFILANTISILGSCFSATCSYLYAMRYIYQNYHEPVDIVMSDSYLKILTHGILRMNFYERPQAHFIYLTLNGIDSVKEIAKYDKRPLLMMEWRQGTNQRESWGSLYPYLFTEYNQFPHWLQVVDINHWEERTNRWYVYRVKGMPNI